MRTLIISDVHANLNALDAVLADASPFDRVFCLGDVIGYGPDPNACIERMMDLPSLTCVMGNHDAAILGAIEARSFNYEARASLAWLEHELAWEQRCWLRSLKERIVIENFTIVHGSPRNPIWEYVMDLTTARANMPEFDTPICLIGHTHLPGIYRLNGESVDSLEFYPMASDSPFKIDQKALINPGSVGQPRDHDPRAAYLLFDDAADRWEFRRAPYDVAVVQARIRAAGLPERHALRLAGGW